MGAIRVMFIGQGPSGLPEDVAVNTFHFYNPVAAATPADVNDATNLVAGFYTNTTSSPAGTDPQIRTIGEYLSPWVNRAAEVRGYDLADAKPRVPHIVPITLGGTVGTTGLPEEVAVCLSYNGDPPNTPRRRGRIYIGPLSSAVYDASTATANSHPSAVFCNDLAIAARRLANSDFTGWEWSIRSTKPSENYVKITHGYVDNAFDTQIRRGPDTTARVLWQAIDVATL